MGKEPINGPWSYSRIVFLAFITKIMNIDFITVSGSMNRSRNQGINEEEGC